MGLFAGQEPKASPHGNQYWSAIGHLGVEVDHPCGWPGRRHGGLHAHSHVRERGAKGAAGRPGVLTKERSARGKAAVLVAVVVCSRCGYHGGVVGERPEAELFDVDELDEQDPFEIDAQAAHLFKHPHLGVDDIAEVWAGAPLFYPAKPPAHWLMVAEVAGRVLMVPSAVSRSGDVRRCRPIGCYEAAPGLAAQYRRDR